MTINQSSHKIIQVWADWDFIPEPLLVGHLMANTVRGKEVLSFEYNNDWLISPYAFSLDPALYLYPGKQYLKTHKPNFGIFLDSAPDRWGRMLIQRREALLAKKEKRNQKNLFESDFLLGVFDQHRMGGLRFKFENSPFLDNQKDYKIPPFSYLRKLEAISLKLEDEQIENDVNYDQWLQMILAPGSSLGGARPKASVCDPKKHLWIAKFPSRQDQIDVGAWEYLIYLLAKNCELSIPEAQIKKITSRHHTFLSKRFDRNAKNKRIHFSSVMTLLERNDGDHADNGACYLELVDFIIKNGAQTNKDLEELWKRIVFYISVSNTDDHLRNHGFLYTKKGWQLSPAYDMNPNQYGNGLSLNISETSNELSFDLAMSVCEAFRLNKNKANKILKKIKKEVSFWQKTAKYLKIPASEQNQMAGAFRY